MAPKMPSKFDDISKTASSVLGDDFQCKNFQLKSKQKTNLDGATCEATVDAFGGSQNAKLSFKFPKPVASLEGLAIDKLDLEKDGKAKVECNLGKALHGVDGLKVGVTSSLDLSTGFDVKDVSCSTTYTAMADTSVKLETKIFDPSNFSVECLRVMGDLSIGAKINGMSTFCPSVGVNYQAGDLFASVIAKNQFAEFTGHGHYKVSNDVQVAATYQHGGKSSGYWSVGASAALGNDVIAKAKMESNNALSLAFKKPLAKGTTFFGGLSYNLTSSNMTYGAKVNIE